jgi:hypothetical protein
MEAEIKRVLPQVKECQGLAAATRSWERARILSQSFQPWEHLDFGFLAWSVRQWTHILNPQGYGNLLYNSFRKLRQEESGKEEWQLML